MLFPQSGLIGCFFHFGQCLFRNFCDFGLKACYSKDEELKKWLNLCIALAFIPPNSEVLQQEEFLLVQLRYESLVQGHFKSRGRNKIDMQRDMNLLKSKIKFLNSTKEFDDYVNLLESSSKLVQTFD